MIDKPKHYDGTLLGVDFGLRRIGTAIGQTLTCNANPLKIIAAEQGVPALNRSMKLFDTPMSQMNVFKI